MNYKMRYVMQLLILIGLIGGGILFFQRQSTLSTSPTIYLNERLIALGVPINGVQVITESPLQVEIRLQSDSNTDKATQVDMWYKHLASREAELAYLTGTPISSYRLMLLNRQGDIISSETIFITADLPSQTLSSPQTSVINNQTITAFFQSNLNTFGLDVASLEVSENGVVRENTFLVELHLISPDLNMLNQVITPLILSLRPLIEKLNQTHHAQVAIFRLNITDANEQLLLEYILDLDLDTELWSPAKGVQTNWAPHPAPVPDLP